MIDDEIQSPPPEEQKPTKEEVAERYQSLQQAETPRDEDLSKFWDDFYSLNQEEKYGIMGSTEDPDKFMDFLKSCSEANVRVFIERMESPWEDLRESFSAVSADQFKAITNFQEVEPVVAESTKEKMLVHVESILTSLVTISEEDRERARETWRKAVVMDNNGVSNFIEEQKKLLQYQIKTAQEAFAGTDEAMAKEVISAIEISGLTLDSIPRSSPAFVYRFPPSMEKAALEAGIESNRLLILNTSVIEKMGETELVYIATEETLHMVNKLELYGHRIHKAWVEETFTKLLSVSHLNNQGHKLTPEFYSNFRLDGYAALFTMLQHQTSLSSDELYSIYFGSTSSDSPKAKKVEQAIETIDLIGILIDNGMNTNQVVEYLKGHSESKEE